MAPASPTANSATCGGDAIEWNVAINDRNILISDHVIDNINCTNGKINWGLVLALRAVPTTTTTRKKQTVKNFVVANITGSNCRQLVHVENGKHFIIRNIKAKILRLISVKRRE